MIVGVAFNVEKSNLNNKSVDYRLDQPIGDWLDEQYKVDIPDFSITENYPV